MLEATRPGLLTSVAFPLTYAGWDCGRGSASSSGTELAWWSSSSSSGCCASLALRVTLLEVEEKAQGKTSNMLGCGNRRNACGLCLCISASVGDWLTIMSITLFICKASIAVKYRTPHAQVPSLDHLTINTSGTLML